MHYSIFLLKIFFLTKNHFQTAELDLTTRGPLYTCLVLNKGAQYYYNWTDEARFGKTTWISDCRGLIFNNIFTLFSCYQPYPGRGCIYLSLCNCFYELELPIYFFFHFWLHPIWHILGRSKESGTCALNRSNLTPKFIEIILRNIRFSPKYHYTLSPFFKGWSSLTLVWAL